MKTNIVNLLLLSVIIFSFSTGCTDLEEEILDETTGRSLLEDTTNLDNLVVPAYGWLRDMWWRQRVWGMQEMSSDEAMIPARGTDWYDGGVWLEFQSHTWTPEHRDIRDTWDALSAAVARANYSLQLLEEIKESQKLITYRAELRLLRAFYMYLIMDLYGQVPYRDWTETDYTKESKVFDQGETFEFLIEEINEIYDDLGNKAEIPYGRVNKDVADALLAKLYLNKEIYTGEADWESCIAYCDRLINSGRYAIADDYFGIFSVNNHENPSPGEAIFVSIMDDNQDMGVDQHVDWVHFVLHYTQSLDGNYAPWNGAIAPESFINTWDTINDIRWQDDRTVQTTGINLGFLIGQQYDVNGDSLFTRQKEPLNFTIECPLDGATEEQGVRVIKYEPKVPVIDEFRVPNDYVIFRISDFYLMRAEAKFRAGQDGTADLNAVRTKRGLDPVNALTEDIILNERGFELYWEGHRRQDLIRFDRFTDAYTNKPETSEDKELYPIPQSALDVNSNLKQNPSY